MMYGLSESEWDHLLLADRAQEADKRRRNNPYVLDLVRVVPRMPNGMKRSMVLHIVRKNRERLGLSIPRTFDDTVQQCVERHCIDSEVFLKRKAPTEIGLFCWPRGPGAGYWSAIPDRVDAWLANHQTKQRATY